MKKSKEAYTKAKKDIFTQLSDLINAKTAFLNRLPQGKPMDELARAERIQTKAQIQVLKEIVAEGRETPMKKPIEVII